MCLEAGDRWKGSVKSCIYCFLSIESQAHRHLATRLTDDRTNPIPSDTDRQPECPDGPATAGQVDHGEVSPAVSLVYRLWQLLRKFESCMNIVAI